MSKSRLSFLDRYLTVWIFLAMAIGVSLGSLFEGLPAWLNSLSVGSTNIPIAIGLILMMYPPLAKVRYEELHDVFEDRRMLALSLIQNWIDRPGADVRAGRDVSARPAGVHDRPDPDRAGPLHRHGAGLEPAGAAATTNTSPGWSPSTRSSRSCSSLPMRGSSLVPAAALRARGQRDRGQLLDHRPGRADLLGIPFLAGFLTRRILIARAARPGTSRRFLPRIGPITLVALLFTIVAMFSLKGGEVLRLPFDALLIAMPLTIYFVVQFLHQLRHGQADRGRLSAHHRMAFTAAGNNFELAIAVAIAAFGLASPVAFATVIGPLVEVPVLILLVQVALRLGERWLSATGPVAPGR